MSFTSCEDFLEVSSPDELTTGNFWRDEKDAQAALAASYAQLYHGDAYAGSEVRFPVEEFRSDIYTLGSGTGSYDQWHQIYNFNYTNGNTQFSWYYKDLYRGINFANQILANVPNIPAEKIPNRDLILNEAHFLRGYYHLMAQLLWEKIIIRDEYVDSQDKLYKGVSERVDSWKFIIEDLEKATSLPAKRTVDEVGRATKGAAYAYLGFAYLTRSYEEADQKEAFLEKAVKAFDEVKGYKLVSGDSYIDMFNGRNKNCEESIFEIQFTMNQANGAEHIHYLNQFIATLELKGWDMILPNEFLMNEYMKEGLKNTVDPTRYDERLYSTIYYKCDYFNQENVMGKDYDYWFSKKDEEGEPIPGTAYNKPSFRKYTPKTAKEMPEVCAINLLLMRYANVLLLKAEALNEQGHPELAADLVDQVRKEHGNMPKLENAIRTDQNKMREQIEHERILEFPLENSRWFDLCRWKKAEKALSNVYRDFNGEYFYPIPKWEVDANPLVK